MKLTRLITTSIVVFALSACGGGGGSSGGGDNNADGGGGSDEGGSNVGGNDEDPTGTDVDPVTGPAGDAPTAEDLTLEVGSSPYIELQLIGNDPQNDSIQFVLDSPASGNGYQQAFVDSDSGEFYVTITDERDAYEFLYRTTDGSNFSEQATITLTTNDSNSALETGLSEAEVDVYGDIPIAFFDGDLFGSSADDRTVPRSIDLSGNFPTPGSQGNQNSCVAWAAGYALKSYQEKIEENWSFSPATTFSPAFIYNQTNLGQDQGSSIYGALQLIVDRGAAPLQSFPYSDVDHTSQPGSTVLAEASQYKAGGYQRLSGLSQIKSALANRQPVVMGIKVFDNFYNLFGSSSVYNTTSGNNDGPHGLHAVTAVGYDDDRFGGAVKIINSWGTEWGDGGYFWLTYSLFSDVVLEAYVLQDKANTGADVVVPDPPAPTSGPNLLISDWFVEYNPQPSGEGNWQWEVANTGDVAGGLGVDVNLMLSRDNLIDNSDVFVVYEEMSFNLEPGQRGGRYEDNARAFEFPETLEPGEYYMAVWVDDLSELVEIDENDNVTFGESTVEFLAPALPDIAIESWAAAWDTSTGDGTFEYRILNNGTSATTNTDWDINLVLSRDAQNIAYYLFFEDSNFILQPGEIVFRDETSAAPFNLLRSQLGNDVPAGEYFIGAWVDDLDQEEESNEINNSSFDNLTVQVGANSKHAKSGNGMVQTAFNGMRIPERVLTRKVEIIEDENGNLSLKMPKGDEQSSISTAGKSLTSKSLRSGDKAIFPVTKRHFMPAAKSFQGYDK